MDVATVLLHLLVVLASAKLAAELSERVRVPPVVGEILAGVVVGPSVLGLVPGDAVIRVLGELGVILLLLEVGLEMDLQELGAVGGTAVSVATIGVVLPFVAGGGVGLACGMSGHEALFVGAALTATSVGITARVFGDLRALAGIEARTVLGAAVADDVMGLVILTVVVRVATAGSVSPGSVVGLVALALAFLVVTTLVGVRVVPSLLDAVGRFSRSSGTLLGLTLAFTLGVAELANAVKLAPIVGAFVAGLVLTRSRMAGRVRRELTPVNHVLVPVFFLQIGIEAKVGQFVRPGVLALAGALLAVAVAGKVAAGLVVNRGGADRLLVGMGMIPRGEVGLIFATLGLQQHIFGRDVYAAVLLVVLATTLITPPLLRWRLQTRPAGTGPARARAAVAQDRPWLEERGQTGSLVLELVAEPPSDHVLAAALEIARRAERAAPAETVYAWLEGVPRGPLRWTEPAREAWVGLLSEVGPRGWRFLTVTGVLERALPELAGAMATSRDGTELDPLATLGFPITSAVQERVRVVSSLSRPDQVVLAALIREVARDRRQRLVLARKTASRLRESPAAEEALAGLVDGVELFAGVARSGGPRPERVLQLASHLADRGRVEGLYVLAQAEHPHPIDRARLAELRESLTLVMSDPDLVDRRAVNDLASRRAAASRLARTDKAKPFIDGAPRAFVSTQTPEALAAQATMLAGVAQDGAEGVVVGTRDERGQRRIDIAARDRIGLLASHARALHAVGATIVRADVATWDDGWALGSFVVDGGGEVDQVRLRALLAHGADGREPQPVPEATLAFDDAASPWHTVCRIEADDRAGILADFAGAFALGGFSVHQAVVSTAEGRVVDLFELTTARGEKLDPTAQERVRQLVWRGRDSLPRRPRLAQARERLRRLALP